MTARKTMRQVLAEEKCVLAPEVYDCASAWTVEQCGYKATVLSGAEVSKGVKATLRSKYGDDSVGETMEFICIVTWFRLAINFLDILRNVATMLTSKTSPDIDRFGTL